MFTGNTYTNGNGIPFLYNTKQKKLNIANYFSIFEKYPLFQPLFDLTSITNTQFEFEAIYLIQISH